MGIYRSRLICKRLLVRPLAFPSCPTRSGQMAEFILQLSMLMLGAVLELCKHLLCQSQC